MSLPFGTIQVNQVTPAGQPVVSVNNTQTIAIIGPFPKGPAGWTLVDPSNALNIFGTPNTALNYSGPITLEMAAAQGSGNATQTLQLLVYRSHLTNATATLTDGSSHNTVQVTAAGVYAGSAGNVLKFITLAPLVQVQRIQFGNGSQNEIQQITFYNTSGMTGTVTFGITNAAGTAKTTPSITFNAVPSSLVTAMGGTNGQGTAGLNDSTNGFTSGGGGANLVSVAAGTPPFANAIVINVTFNGTGYAGIPQPLITVTPTLTASGTSPVPIQQYTVTNTLTNTVLQTVILSTKNQLQTSAGLVAAINSNNQGLSGIISATLLSLGNTYATGANNITLINGADGVGGTVANDSGSTISGGLAQLASGVYGEVDFLCGAFDASGFVPLAQAAINTGLGNNLFIKAILGAQAGTSKATLEGSYQNANSSRITIVAPDQMPANVINGGTVPGYAIAAGIAGLKAITSAEYNLYNQALTGIANTVPIDPATGTPYTPTDTAALTNALLSPLYWDGPSKQLRIGKLSTTASLLNPDGSLNPFQYLTVQHCWDQIAYMVVAGVKTIIGSPSTSITSMQNSAQSLINSILFSTYNRYHNGFQATVIFDPTQNLLTFNITFGPRIPLGAIVVNLGALVGFSN